MIAIYTSRRARPDDKIKLGDTEELQRKLPCPAGSSEPYWDILEESSTGVFFGEDKPAIGYRVKRAGRADGWRRPLLGSPHVR